MRETLIYHKKKMYYLLIHMNESDMLESEAVILSGLLDDMELRAELEYIKYMKGDQ